MKYEENFREVSRKGREKNDFIIIFKYWATNIEVGIILFLYSRFHFCVFHQRKMKAIRRSLKKYLERKLEELMGVIDEMEEKEDFEIRK